MHLQSRRKLEPHLVPSPRAAVSPISDSHSVHLYEDDESIFLDNLGEFVGGALGSGRGCVVIATEPHRTGLAERLRRCGVDIQLAADQERYMALDADETLAQFMVRDWPDQALFLGAIEPVLLKAQRATGRPRDAIAAFGEMVAVLWGQGKHDAAVRLEHIWNDVVKRHWVWLRCAYPMSCFAKESQDALFQQVCGEHTEVIPTEGYILLGSDEERLRMVSSLQQKASLVRAVVEAKDREIEQRKRVEEKLRRSEQFARNVMESSADCVQVLDLDGRLDYMSPPGLKALEITDASEILGRPWVDFWKDEDRPKAQATVAAALAGGVGSFQADTATKGGTRKSWDVKVTPSLGSGGEIDSLVAVSRDVTELRRAQQMAVQAEKLAAAGRMAATIAHEINNPLEAVTNFIYLAKTTPALPEEVDRYLEIADRELTRVAQIAQKTLGFYRDTSKNKWVDVCELIQDVMLIYERKLRYKHIEASASIDPGLRMYGKQGEIKQALANLIANAIDASSDGGKILVRARASRDWTDGMEPGVRISLADNGAGMAPEVQKRLFVPFFTTKAEVGTGIGLWVTKSLIEQYGGYLHFRSRQGTKSGTIMSFFVPDNGPHGEGEIALVSQ